MSDAVVPAGVKLAAKRGFVRTTAQAYAATLTGGLITSVIALITDPSNLVPVAVAVLTAVVTPPAAGLASYLSIISNGVPKEYQDVAFAGVLTRKEYQALVDDEIGGAV